MKKLILTGLVVISNLFGITKDLTSLDDIIHSMNIKEIRYLTYLLKNDRVDDALLFIHLMEKDHKCKASLTIVKVKK